MRLIAAVDQNWGIGNQGTLLADIARDKRRFRELTTGGVILGGRKTMEGLPGARALPGRKNLVLTRQVDYRYPGADVVHGVSEALEAMRAYPPEKRYIIGGGEVYHLFLPYCDEAYLTRIDHAYPADTFFPNLEREPVWTCAYHSEKYADAGLTYDFAVYRRKH